MTSSDKVDNLRTNNGLYVLVNSQLDEKYSGVNEALGDVLGSLLGAMTGRFQITEDMTFNIYFSLRLNLGFKLYILPSFGIDVRDLDVAIDVWGEQNDLLDDGTGKNYVTSEDRDENNYKVKLLDGTKPHILGIYYDNDQDTGKAGLYVDAEALLGKDAKLFVDMSEYSLEEVITGLVAGIGKDATAAEASVATDYDATAKNPDKQSADTTSLFVNIFTNALALNVTSGFAKVLIKELLPDNASIADMLPNLKVYLKQNLNPYDITIGAILFNEEGNVPVLNLGLNIQGLNGVEGESSSIEFGRKEDILKMQQGSNAIFYYANFYRDNGNTDYSNYYGKNYNAKDYVKLFHDPTTGYDYIENADGSKGDLYTGKDADGNTVAGPEDRYMKAAPVMSEVLASRQVAYTGDLYTDVEGAYILVYKRLNDIAGNNNLGEDYAEYRNLVKTNQFASFTGTLYTVDNNNNFVKTDKDTLKGFTGEGNLQYVLESDYNAAIKDATVKGILDEIVNTGNAVTYNGQKYYAICASGADYTSMSVADTFAEACPNVKVYKQVTDFTNYTKALALNLGDLLGGGTFDVTSMLADLECVELGLNLDIRMTLDDVINWTYQFTRFIDDPQISEYLYFIATSLENSKEFQSLIGLNLDLKVYLKMANLVKMIAGDKSVGILQALEGAKIYLELTYETNFHGDEKPKALLWVEIKDGKLYLNIDASQIGDIVGWGDFFSYGVVDGLDLSSILGSSATTASAQALIAADDDEEVNTGLIPANIWSILNIVLGRLLIANDFITVGFNETLIADLIGMLADSDSEVLQGISEFLPKLYTTDTKDTSGITINFYGNSPSIDINLGFKVGTLYYETVNNFNAMYGANGKYSKGSDWSGTTFKKESDGSYTVGKVEKKDSTGATVTDNDNTYVLVSTDDYALVAYAYPAWEGITYDYDATTNTFTKHTESGTKGAYLKQGDFAIAISLGKIYAKVNKDFSVDKDEKFADRNADNGIKYVYVESKDGEYVKDADGTYRLATDADIEEVHYAKQASYDNYVKLQNATAHLEMSIEISMYGSGKAGNANIIDLSEILDLIMGLISPNSAISGSQLKLNIANEFGNNNGAYLTLDLVANIDVETYKVELGLRLNKRTASMAAAKTLIGLYLIENAVYVDLSGILGETAKIAVTDLNLDGLLEGVLGKYLNQEDTSDASGASIASKDDIATIEKNKDHLREYAYFMINVTPQKLLLQLNADFVNAIYKKIMAIRNLEQKDLIPDIGDLLVRMDASETGAKNYVKMTEAEKATYTGKTYKKVGLRYVEVTDGTKGDYKQDGNKTSISLNLRFSDGLYFCLDIPAASITKDTSESVVSIFGLSTDTKEFYKALSTTELSDYDGTRYAKKSDGTYEVANTTTDGVTYYAPMVTRIDDNDLATYTEVKFVKNANGNYIRTSVFEGTTLYAQSTAYSKLTWNGGKLFDGASEFEGTVYVKRYGEYEVYQDTTYSESTNYYKQTVSYTKLTFTNGVLYNGDELYKGGKVYTASTATGEDGEAVTTYTHLTQYTFYPYYKLKQEQVPRDYIEILSLDLESLVNGTGTFDISSLNLPTIGLKASLNLTMTSKNLKSGDVGYDESLAGWVKDLLANLLGGTAILGKFSALTLTDGKLYDGSAVYTGKVYTKNSSGDYILHSEKTYVSGTTYYKYTLADVNITMANEINLTIDIAANVNLAPILAYGIGGILYSDIAVDISLGKPVGSKLISLYYLGSSRLMKKSGTGWELKEASNSGVYSTTEIFSDALYVDASGLGLGKIKLQGIAGLLGATPSYDAKTASGASVSADATTSDADTAAANAAASSALYLQIDIQNGRLGVTFDNAFISTLIGMLGLDLGDIELPPIKSVALEVNIGAKGLDSINLNAQLDSVGTGANINISGFELGFGESMVDTANLIEQVKTGYTGLTYSKTSGLMSLVQNAIDSLKPGLNINIQNKVWQLTQAKGVATLYEYNNININGKKVLTSTNISDSSPQKYNIRLDLKSDRADTGLTAILGGNNIFVTNITLPSGGLVGTLAPMISALKCLDLGSMLGSSPLLALVKGTDGDDATYEYPSAKTASDSATTASDTATAAADSGYNYPLNLENLIKSVEVNLFNSNGYWPYFSGATAVSNGAGKISVKVKLNKDAYNELIIKVITVVLGLMKDVVEKSSSEAYFGDVQKARGYKTTSAWVWEQHEIGDVLIDGVGKSNEITNIFNTLQGMVDRNATTQEKIVYLEPIARSLPVSMTKWALLFALDAAGVSLSFGTIKNLASEVIEDLNFLLGGILPIPFATGDIDPSINIYIDLNPTASEYGCTSGQTVKPGIQAIEIMVNAEKTGTGASEAMKYNKAITNTPSSMNRMANSGGASGTTTDLNWAWDFFMIRITPYSTIDSTFTTGMLYFDEAESADTITTQTTPPTEIVIDDPATRSGNAVKADGSTTAITLRDSAFLDATVFPQYANVKFPVILSSKQMQSYDSSGSYKDAIGTQIVWDAATVDLTAATSEDTSGRRLAGYVYGYALNVVMYAIPVYVTNDKEAQTQSIKGYYRNDDGTYSEKALGIDIDTNSSKYMAELPDLVRIPFRTGGKQTFATYLKDSEGNMAYAIIDPKSGTPSQTVNGTAYQILVQPTSDEIAKGAEANLNKDGNKFLLMPAYVAGLVTVKDSNGNDVYQKVKVTNEDGTQVEYYVLSRSKLPTGKAFPAGTIEWNTDDFKYDWQGATDWSSGTTGTVKVGFTYQWGLGKAVTDTISLSAKNYKISRLTSMSTDAEGTTSQSLKSERDSNGNYTTVLELKAMDITSDMQDLVTYLNSFKFVSGKYTSESSMSGFDVEWDTAALAKAIAAITTKDSSGNEVVNFYKGLDVTIKAKVGGQRFSIFTSVTKTLTSTDKTGFVGKSESFAGKFAQEVNVRIVVKPYVFDSMAKSLVFDQYQYKTITADSFGTAYQINVKDAQGNTSVENLTVGSGFQVEAPFIKAGMSYLPAYNNDVHKLTSDEITYEGYSNQKNYPLYAKLVIGTQYSGRQEVYVPITVNAIKPSTVSLTVGHENTLNPTWFESDEYDTLNVSVGMSTHTMFPDWTTVQYYTNAACTKLKSQQNIFDGGTIYAQVEAYATADGKKDGTKLALVNTGKVDEKGNPIYSAQKITLRLNVEQQSIQSVQFFWDKTGTIGDVAAYARKYANDKAKLDALKLKLADISNYTGSVYQQTHVGEDGTAFGIDPINFATNPSDYFKTSDWGDAIGGTPVKVNLVKGESYIAYVRVFDTVVSGKGIDGTSTAQTVYMTIGNNKVSFNVNIPSYEFTGGAMSDAESKLAFVGGKVAGTEGDTLTLKYNVFDEWKLPSKATAQTAQGVGDITVDVKWVDYAAPSKDELKSDDGGKYVERKYFFFDGLSMRYPSADAFTAKIYLEGFDENVTITPDGMSNNYDVFDKFEFARTATVTVGNVKHLNVPIHWESTAMPTADEIKNGSFTRKMYVLGAYVDGKDIYRDFIVTIKNNFTLESRLVGYNTAITGGYEKGDFAIDLAKDNFYQGLPKIAAVKVGEKIIPVTLAWSDDYTAESGFNGNMTLTITSKDGDEVVLESTVNVDVTVATAGITGLAAGQKFNLDPYAKDSTLFKSGTWQKVNVNGSDKTQLVTVEYEFDNQEFYDNVASCFGKKYKVAVTYKYNGGKSDNVETGEIEVYVVNRSIMFMSDYKDRSIVVDTFLHKDASYLDNEMSVTTMGGDVFDAYFDWSDVDKLIKSGKSNSAYMATALVGVEKANGGYVLADITDDNKENPTYVAIEDYVEYKQQTDPNFALTTETRYMIAKQRVNIPVTVLDRTIADAELLLDDTDLEYLYSDSSKYSTITDTLVGKTNGDGRYIDIVYNKATGMPEQYVYYNHFAYVGADKLPDTMRLTFANGDVGDYHITYENAPTASDIAGLTSTLERKMTVHVWNAEADEKFEVMDAFEMSIKIRVSKVTLTNSDLAYEDMSVGSYKYTASVYADRAKTVYDTSKYASTATYYVGAQFMLAQTWWTEGRSVNAGNYEYNSTYTKRHGFTDSDGKVYPGIYSVYSTGDKFKAEGEENRYKEEGVKFYVYNADTKNYTLYTGDVSYGADETTYKSASGQDLYILVYVTKQTLNVSWSADNVNYTYRGGNVAVAATLTSPVADNGATSKVDVTVRIANSKATGTATLVDDDTCTLLSGMQFVIDPYDDTNVFARTSGYSGDRYEPSTTDSSGYVKNNLDGTYKLVDGQYVELSADELNRDYVNFPTRLTVTLANGATVDVPVTWDFSSVNVTYAGGEYYAYAIVNYDGKYNYKATDSSSANEVGTQRIRFTVKVNDRSVKAGKDGIADETELKKLAGYAYGVNSGVAAYINPYEYIKPTMPTSISLNERQADGTYTAQTYSTTSDTRKLTWSFDEFRPSYNGGVVYVVAKLVGIDGNVQTFKIPFLVQKMEATNITEAQTTVTGGVTKLTAKTGGYSSDVVSGVASSAFSVDPNDPNRLTMPFTYIGKFKVSTPTYDAANDKVTVFTDVTDPQYLEFFYAIVSMPADEQYTVTSSGITTSASGSNATVQLGDQERISVKIDQTNSTLQPTKPTVSSLYSGTTLKMTTTVSGASVNVVWFGTVEVYSVGDKVNPSATYAVMFSSSGANVTLPTYADRKVVYKLYAAVGTVVDGNGTVVTTQKATKDFADSHTAVQEGQTIPEYQVLSDMATFTING